MDWASTLVSNTVIFRRENMSRALIRSHTIELDEVGPVAFDGLPIVVAQSQCFGVVPVRERFIGIDMVLTKRCFISSTIRYHSPSFYSCQYFYFI